MKIWHVSDSHCLHSGLIPEDVDMVIHSGDCANSRDVAKNTNDEKIIKPLEGKKQTQHGLMESIKELMEFYSKE